MPPEKIKSQGPIIFTIWNSLYRGRETDVQDGDVLSAWLTVAPVAVGSQVCNVLLELTHPSPGIQNAGNGKSLAKSHLYFHLIEKSLLKLQYVINKYILGH
jgi:hypothetical protein